MLLATGCGGGLGPGSEAEGRIARGDEALEEVVEDAGDVLFEAGRPVDGGSPCAVLPLSGGRSLAIEAESDDFDMVALVVDREGSLVALSDDWEDGTDSWLVVKDVPRGARLVLFALDGSTGEYSVVVEEADSGSIEEYAASDLAGGSVRGELVDDKDDDLLEDELEDELDAWIYASGYGTARVHPFEVDEEGLVSLSLQSDHFDPILALVRVEDDQYDYVAHNDDYAGGLGSRIDMVLEEGRYLAVVLPYSPSETGRYTITMETYRDDAMVPHTTIALEPGEWYTGSIVAGSALAFSVWPEIVSEAPYDLMITAATPCASFEFEIPGGSGALYEVEAASEFVDTYMCLLRRDSDGVSYIESNDDWNGSDSRIMTVLSPGTYAVLVASYSGTDTGEVAFRYGPADFEPVGLLPGSPVDALVSWDAPELYFSFEAVAGRTYTVNATSAEIDPYVEAILVDGTILSDDDSGGYPNSRLTIDPLPSQSGPVLLTVRDYGGSTTGAVRVDMAEQRRTEAEIFAMYD